MRIFSGLRQSRVFAAVVVTVVVVPMTAYATHSFADVEDGRFFTEPVEWAADNGITTGKSPTTFDPFGNVTRGETVTFLKRYHDFIVQPGLDTIEPVPPIPEIPDIPDYENLIVVAKSGGDFTSVTAAMNAIGTDADYPASSASQRYLVWVAPGVYEDEDITMKPYVDIEGSGQGVTVLRSVRSHTGIAPAAATLVGADNAEVRHVTVEVAASAGGNWTHAIYTSANTGFKNVTAVSTGGQRSRGILVANGGRAILIDVIMVAKGASDSNLGLDVVQSEVFADGLFVDVEGGVAAKGIFINTAASEVQLENVTTHVSGGATDNVGVEFVNSLGSLEGLRSVVTGSAKAHGVACYGVSYGVRILGATIYAESTGTLPAEGIRTAGCDAEVRNVVADAVSAGGQATGMRHIQSHDSIASNLTVSDAELRATSGTFSAFGLALVANSAAAGTYGRVSDVAIRATGGTEAQDSFGISHGAPGDVHYRGLSIIAEGDARFLFGIKATLGTPRFDDVEIDAAGNADITVFGAEILGASGSSVSNARISAVNTGTSDGRDAVGAKINGASDVTFADITAYAAAETNVWGIDLVSATNARLIDITANAVGAPGNWSHGVRCWNSTIDVDRSTFVAEASATSVGFQGSNCASVVNSTSMVGGTYGAYLFGPAAGLANGIRDSYVSGGTSAIRTTQEAEAYVVGSQLDGGAGSSGSATDVQECTAVTYNSGGSEQFQAGASDPCP